VTSLENEIQMLMPGEALITSPHVPFAMPVKVHLYEEHVERLRVKAAAAPAAAAAGTRAAAPMRVGEDFYG
jgi:hypothetical protein